MARKTAPSRTANAAPAATPAPIVALDAARARSAADFRARLDKPLGKIPRATAPAEPPSEIRLALGSAEIQRLQNPAGTRRGPAPLREKAPRSPLAEKCRENLTPRPADPPAAADRDAALVEDAYRLAAAEQEATTFYQADAHYDTVARYDYAAYEYLLEPLAQPSWPGSDAPAAPDPAPDWDGPLTADERAFLDALSTGLHMGFARLNLSAARTRADWYDGVARRDFPNIPPVLEDSVPDLPAPLKDLLARFREIHLAFAPTIHSFPEFIARTVTAAYAKEPAIAQLVLSALPRMTGQSEALYKKACKDWLGGNLYTVEVLGWPTLLAAAVEVLGADYPELLPDAAGRRAAAPPGALLAVPANYPFTVFRSPSVNLGLRLVYRQDWDLLGVQPGEIVKTIPLGPGQSTRISTTLSRRTRTTRTRETSQVVERSTQSTDTTRASNEIVQETANTNTLYLTPGEGSFSLGFISVGVTKAPSYEEQKTSRNAETSSRINESVQQAASRVQSQTRVAVSTEGEESFQETSSMEISNPNSEVALNYEYLHLQHLYEVFTRLAEVEGVVYVAEDLPAPHSIDGNWVRRHAWILSRALLDESFRPVLDEINRDAPAGGGPDPRARDRMGELLGAVAENFAKFTGVSGGSGGLTIPDIYSGALKSYFDWDQGRQAADGAEVVRERQRRQFYRHLYDHILHYSRAIWMREDHDQRMLRYRKRGVKVPVWWRASGSGGGQSVWGVPGAVDLEPAAGGEEVPVEDVIVPGPPIGFWGNYAIYRYRGLGAPRPAGVAGGHDLGGGAAAGRYHLDWIMEALGDFYADPEEPGAVLDPDLARARAEAGGPGEEAERLFRRRHTGRVMFNSGNLYLNLRRGAGTAMEPFKLLHRTVDVLKAVEERDRLRLENRRLGARLEEGRLEDPEVEKVVRVEGPPPPGIAVNPG